jgi:hypothetical protein
MIGIIHSSLTNVMAYFRMFSYDQSWAGDINIPPASLVSASFQTFSGLLDTIVARSQSGERDFLIGYHGNPNGLPLPLHSGTPVTANHDLLDLLTTAASGNSRSRSDLMNTVDPGNRKIFGTQRALDDLLAKIRAVQALHIKSLHFRACNLGAGPALGAIHRALGSAHTEAPRVLFVWSNIATAAFRPITATQLARQISGLGFPQRIFSRVDCLIATAGLSATDPAVAMSVVIGRNGRPTSLTFRALSTDAIKGWTNSFLWSTSYWACGVQPAGGGYRRGGALPIIGLFAPNRQFPVLFPGDGFAYLENIAAENR